MNTTFQLEQANRSEKTSTTPRLVSIDVFRGITMAVMIFVNELDGVRGLPWWTHHARANVDAMTYVDMVFPFFLFAVGLSFPLAIEARLKRDSSQPALWLHVLARSASLIVLGLILANAEKASGMIMGISGSLWGLLGIFFSALFLLDYRPWKSLQPYSRLLQIGGLVGVALLYAIFRRTTSTGQSAWIEFSYPEILGLIGFAYLSVAILYIPTRRWKWAPAIWFILLVALCALTNNRMNLIHIRLPLYVWPFGNGSSCCIVMAGVLVSTFFGGANPSTAASKPILTGLFFGLVTFAAGWGLMPLGISKIRATPTWCLWSIAASSILFALLYWACDVKNWQAWAAPVRPAGSNTLTTYLLPDVWFFLFSALGLTFWEAHFNSGWPGVAKTVFFTGLILAIAALLTRAKVRLRL
jgi:heparan-alpha-glucosaminide N-acetyltransferase